MITTVTIACNCRFAYLFSVVPLSWVQRANSHYEYKKRKKSSWLCHLSKVDHEFSLVQLKRSICVFFCFFTSFAHFMFLHLFRLSFVFLWVKYIQCYNCLSIVRSTFERVLLNMAAVNYFRFLRFLCPSRSHCVHFIPHFSLIRHR